MTIQFHTGRDTVTNEPAIQITLTNLRDIKKLQAALARALNTAPEFGKDWFELCRKLEGLIEREDKTIKF